MYLARAKYEQGIWMNIVPDKINFMCPAPAFYGHNKIKVVFVKVMDQVLSIEYRAQIPDTEPAGINGLLVCSGNLSDRNYLHYSTLCGRPIACFP